MARRQADRQNVQRKVQHIVRRTVPSLRAPGTKPGPGAVHQHRRPGASTCAFHGSHGAVSVGSVPPSPSITRRTRLRTSAAAPLSRVAAHWAYPKSTACKLQRAPCAWRRPRHRYRQGQDSSRPARQPGVPVQSPSPCGVHRLVHRLVHRICHTFRGQLAEAGDVAASPAMPGSPACSPMPTATRAIPP